ncbi:MAG: fasciclin domain-containing protein [Euryarchaeota archaeon]|nr:fasciclin domain-containing protein [Euryarchaeota archaeon]
MVSHVADPTVNQTVCEAYSWVPAVDIAMTAQATTIHNSLVAALAQADLVATLQGAGPFTVFAPTDAAFAAAGIDLAALDTDDGKETLTDILTYHVVSGSVNSSALTDGMTATSLNGDDLTFAVGEGVMVNDANVTLADVPASNGVIHVIDKVLMPPADLRQSRYLDCGRGNRVLDMER